MTKAEFRDKAAYTAETVANICSAVETLRDEWEQARGSAALTAEINGVRDTLDAFQLMAAAYKSELARRAK